MRATSWWQLFLNILGALIMMQTQNIALWSLILLHFVKIKIVLLNLDNLPSCCLLHLGFDGKAIYGVIVLLYCCLATELWVFCVTIFVSSCSVGRTPKRANPGDVFF